MKLDNLEQKFRYFKLNFVMKFNLYKKKLLIVGLLILIPMLLAIFLFYGNLNLSNITASLITIKTREPNVENINKPSSTLKLISRNEFLKKYNPEQSSLPQTTQWTSSLSTFIQTNTSTELLPARNWSVPFIDIASTVALAIEMPSKRVLYGKNAFEVRQIASLTKLMTALIVYENLNLEDEVTISQKALNTEGNSANFVAGEKFTVKQLLYALLLESSNDAAVALEEFYNQNYKTGLSFIDLMNAKVRELGIQDANFEEPSGLSINNVASAHSVAQILHEAFTKPELKEIMATSSFITQAKNRDTKHYWINLNTLLGAYDEVLAGKTGYIEEAGPSIAILTKTSNPNKYLVIVMLDSQDRTQAATSLLEWIHQAYIWEQ